MVTIEISYEGQLRCNAIHTPSNCKLSTDAPVDNHGRGESFSPTDLVATALGTCVITVMAIFAERHSVDLGGSRVTVEKHMSTDPPRRIARLPVTVEVFADLDAAMREKLKAAAKGCPVHQSLRSDIDAPITFKFNSGD